MIRNYIYWLRLTKGKGIFGFPVGEVSYVRGRGVNLW